MFKPLTREQFDSAIKAGYKPNDIISMEKRRKEEDDIQTQNLQKEIALQMRTPGQKADEEAGFFKSVGRSLAKPLVWAGSRIGQVASEAIRPGSSEKQGSVSLPGLGAFDVKKPENIKKEVGSAVQLPALAMGPVSGAATYGFGSGLEEGKSVKQSLGQGALYGAGGKVLQYGSRLAEPLVSKVAQGVSKAVPQAVKETAEAGMNKLGSTLQPAINKFNKVIDNTQLFPQSSRNVISTTVQNLKAIGDLPDRMLNNLSLSLEKTNLRLTPQQKLKLGEKLDDVSEFLSKRKIVGTPEMRFNKVDTLYEKTEADLQKWLTENGKLRFADKEVVKAKLNSLKLNFQNERDVLAIEKQIDGMIATLDAKYPSKIPVDRLNPLKRSTFKSAYSTAGDKVSDEVEFAMGDVLKNSIEEATDGLLVNGKPLSEFNKEYGTLITARKLLNVAKARNQVGLVGRLVSAAAGGSLGSAIGGPIGTAIGTAAGSGAANIVAGTPTRSLVGAAARQMAGNPTSFVKQALPPIGLSIENVGNKFKLEELGKKLNQLNAQWVKNPTPANKKALDAAMDLYKKLSR